MVFQYIRLLGRSSLLAGAKAKWILNLLTVVKYSKARVLEINFTVTNDDGTGER